MDIQSVIRDTKLKCPRNIKVAKIFRVVLVHLQIYFDPVILFLFGREKKNHTKKIYQGVGQVVTRNQKKILAKISGADRFVPDRFQKWCWCMAVTKMWNIDEEPIVSSKLAAPFLTILQTVWTSQQLYCDRSWCHSQRASSASALRASLAHTESTPACSPKTLKRFFPLSHGAARPPLEAPTNTLAGAKLVQQHPSLPMDCTLTFKKGVERK